MVINFICRASKADKSGQSPLEVSIIINGVRRYVHLDRKVKAADFNAKTQKVKRDASTNEYLVALRTKLYSLETQPTISRLSKRLPRSSTKHLSRKSSSSSHLKW